MNDGHTHIKFYLAFISTLILYLLCIAFISLGMTAYQSMPRPENLLTPFKLNKPQSQFFEDFPSVASEDCQVVADLIDITAHELKWS